MAISITKYPSNAEIQLLIKKRKIKNKQKNQQTGDRARVYVGEGPPSGGGHQGPQ